AANPVLQRLVSGNGCAERLAVHHRDSTLVRLGERRRLLGGQFQVGLEIRPGRTGVEIGELPCRQVAQYSIHRYQLLARTGIWGVGAREARVCLIAAARSGTLPGMMGIRSKPYAL